MPGSRCRNCNQEIVWAKSMSRDSWIPLDPSMDTTGSVRKIRIDDTPYAQVLSGDDLHAAIANGELLWVLHRESCNAFRPTNPMPAHIRDALPARRRSFRS